jgi:4-hydroxysphinganine ceramide fatty acyl 2-hydroxylase
MKKNFVSNSQESVRMFKSNLLEALSKVPFYVPLIVYIPVIGYCIYRSYETTVGLATFFEYMLLGLFVWTFTEYILHRFVFHYLPKPKWGQRLHFIFHGVHHDYPSDALRLVMPPSASIPLAIAFYYLFNAMLPPHYIYAFFPGFIVGYLFYDISHYAIHHFNFKGAFWKKIKHHHMLHHYQDPTKGYGVSSPLWDKVFRSDFIKK